MFDIWRQVKLKQAKNALREGRLDEAFAIAMDKSMRDHRGGQTLLEKLAPKLLDRAGEHLNSKRYREALIDTERALEAGGVQVQASDLREQILDERSREKKRKEKVNQLLDSARRHLVKGSLRTSEERLQNVPTEDSRVNSIYDKIHNHQEKGIEVEERARKHLDEHDYLQACEAAEELVGLLGRGDETRDFLTHLKVLVQTKIIKALEEGDLKTASELHRRLLQVSGPTLDIQKIEDIFKNLAKAGEAFDDARYEDALIYMGRLQLFIPQAHWVKDTVEDLKKLTDSLRALKTGPIGFALEATKPWEVTFENAQTQVAQPQLQIPAIPNEIPIPTPAQKKAQALAATPSTRHLLWIDGVGTYLLLSTDTVSIGRSGSSMRADLPVPTEIEGFHAEIRRIDEDFFITPAQGQVIIDGKSIERKLLEDGDKVELTSRCGFRFYLPTQRTPTAVLKMRKNLRVEGHAQDIILMGGLVILGAGVPGSTGNGCHICVPHEGKPIVLSRKNGHYRLKAPIEIEVDGEGAGLDAEVPVGAHVKIGELTFTITPVEQGRV